MNPDKPSDKQKQTNEHLLDPSSLPTPPQEVNLDQCLIDIGGFGLFQKLATLNFSSPLIIQGFFMITLPLFQTFPKYQCLDEGSGSWEACERSEFCSDPSVTWQVDWSSPYSMRNMIDDLDQHCISPFNLGLIGGSYFLGFIAGSQVLSGQADLHGRIGTFKRYYLASVVGTVMLYFTQSLIWLYIGTFIYGFSSILRTSVALVYAGECGEKKYTSKINFFAQFTKLVLTLLVIFAIWKVTSYWRLYYLIMIFLQLIPWLLAFFFPESPKQLYSQKKYAQLEESLLQILRINSLSNSSLSMECLKPHLDQIRQKQFLHESSLHLSAKVAPPSISSKLAEDPIFKRNFLNILCTWFSTIFIYYQTQFFTKYMNGDLYFNYIFVQLADLTGCTLYVILYNWLGLKGSFLLCYLSSTLGAVLLILVFENPYFIPPLLFWINAGSASAFMTVFQGNLDLFGSEVVASTVGICNLVGRFGGLLAPFSAEFPLPIPLVIFALVSFGQALQTRLLVVTK